jgi:hypothetical protein
VGKSRLINALLSTTIVRVRDKPGLTQSINWYRVRPLNSYVVDMPGYGFAYVKEKFHETWKQLVCFRAFYSATGSGLPDRISVCRLFDATAGAAFDRLGRCQAWD